MSQYSPAHHAPAIAPVAACVFLIAAFACGPDAGERRALDPRPNVLWIVWDTVRADHLSLYGYERATTPSLDAWAAKARVFEDARSAAGYTVPSHASMFTGRVPSEHCAHNTNPTLSAGYTTVAETLRDAGFSTYAFSANPHISDHSGFTQGFERAEHPWTERFLAEARRIAEERVRDDPSTELGERLAAVERGERALSPWNIKAAGTIAETALLEFLDDADAARPWFAFVNYMEAHRPTLPARRFREAFLTAERIEASYRVDRSWVALWSYNFGLRDMSDEELALIRATYDASILELDTLFASLMNALEERGALDHTIVVLTADHGEHLGEHHKLDHQYSLYEPLLRVPLVIHAPGVLEPGRDARPVTTIDLFPTLLSLAGVEVPDTAGQRARNLLVEAPKGGGEERLRIAEEPSIYEVGVATARRNHPGFSGQRFLRRLRALVGDRYKYIWSSNGDHELYDLGADPGELDDLIRRRAFSAKQMQAQLDSLSAQLEPCDTEAPAARELSPEECKRLEMLGYVGECDG